MKRAKHPRTLRTFFTDRRRWCKNTEANGHGAYCLLGGMNRVYGNTHTLKAGIRSKLKDAIYAIFPSRGLRELADGKTWTSISQFNDHPDTTFADIQKVIRRARV